MRQPLPSFTGGDGGGSLFIQRSKVLAGTVVGTFFVHAEGVPGGGAEDGGIGDVVHADGDAEDAG